MSPHEIVAVLKNRRIVLGVTGSIAAYKAAELASWLTQAGAEVDVILTEAAQHFVTPLTFQSLTGRRAYGDADLWGSEGHILHVGLAQQADLLVIAPATANTLAKLAQGLADNLLTLAALAVGCPVLVAPAMDAGMFQHPATQDHVRRLQDRGLGIIGPVEGRMASGLVGRGRMVEPEALFGQVRLALGREGPLAGKKVVVTAGGTREPLDPVRALTNRSTGKQGFALAQSALDRGARVTLITGPSHLPTPVGCERIEVTTAAEMQEAVLAVSDVADVLLMAAAVSDFRPTASAREKLKRREGVPEIRLEPTEDILGTVAARRDEIGRPVVLVGFAAESQNLVANARAKLTEKGLSMIVANDITAPDAGFGADTNRVTMVDADGEMEALPLMTKMEVSEAILERVVRYLRG